MFQDSIRFTLLTRNRSSFRRAPLFVYVVVDL
jgi:hypothetical protein